MYIVPAAGGKARQVRPEFATAFNPLWMPDGKQLLFVGRLDGKSPAAQSLDWWIAPLEGGTAARTGALEIFRGQKLLPRAGSYVIAPDAWAPAAVCCSRPGAVIRLTSGSLVFPAGASSTASPIV